MTDERETQTAAEPSTEGGPETPAAQPPASAESEPHAAAGGGERPADDAAKAAAGPPDGANDGGDGEAEARAETTAAGGEAGVEASAEANAETGAEEARTEEANGAEPDAETSMEAGSTEANAEADAEAEASSIEVTAEAGAEEATAEAPSAESAEASTAEAVSTEEPGAEQPPPALASAARTSADQPASAVASAEASTEAASTEEASTQEPSAEQPSTEQPSAEQPSAEQPDAEPPAAAAAAGETVPEAAGGAAGAKAEAGDGGEEEAAEIDDPNLLALRAAKEGGGTVSGKVIGWNRGGFHVVTHEITAFCPSSEMELGRPRSPAGYMDRELDFKVVKFQRRGRRVVLSRTELLKEQRQQVLAELSPGSVVKGTVTSLPDFGAFVDLGGVEGLVHVSEISRSRVQRPKDALKLGQEVEVKVLKVEEKGERISLSMKDLEPDPWQGVAERYPRGSQFTGKVLRHADFGMFVELEPDVEGLIHVSQLPPGKEMGAEELQPGKTVEGWVREVDTRRQRISLTLREVPEDDPWKDVGQRFPEGEMVEGTVESIAPFGVFINLAPGLTGLLPNSQTGLPRGTNAARAFSPGQQVKVQVLQIDTRRKRISLGKEGSQVEATKADLQEFKKQMKEQEKEAAGAMAAAFAKLRDGN